MGKSIFTTIETEGRAFEVTHSGQTMLFELPDWFLDLKGKMEDAEEIWAWAKENEIELAFCHRAIGQMLIDFRAAARPKDVKGEVQLMNQETAQERIDNLVFKPTKRPGIKKEQSVEEQLEKMSQEQLAKLMEMVQGQMADRE